MHIPTHLMLSWVVGHRLQDRSDRRAVAWAGVAADLDGLSIVAGIDAYGRWHHALTHGLVAGVLIGLLASCWAKDRLHVWWLSLDAWQNWAAAILLLLLCGRIAIHSGYSFAETVLPAADDQAVVAALRQRFASAAPAYVVRPESETP